MLPDHGMYGDKIDENQGDPTAPRTILNRCAVSPQSLCIAPQASWVSKPETEKDPIFANKIKRWVMDIL